MLCSLCGGPAHEGFCPRSVYMHKESAAKAFEGGNDRYILHPRCGVCERMYAGSVVRHAVGEPHLSPPASTTTASTVDHPAHYGGADNPFETIRVIDAWELGFSLGNAVKYISRAGKKHNVDAIEDLKKAIWYLQHEVSRLGTAQAPSNT